MQPEDVGLPAGRRRRTPGLRREELAAIAGVSVDYLARLEQGRDSNPSMAVLGALSEALRLNEVERHHFAKLALGLEHGGCPSPGHAEEQVPETLQAVLDALHPTPALVLGRWLNMLAWNAAWRDFAEPLGIFDDAADGNLARYVFGHPAARERWQDWPVAADMMISALRAARSTWSDEPGLEAAIETLQQYPEFACRWREHRVGEFRTGTVHLDHPQRGEIEVEIETLNPVADQTVQVWLVDRRRAHAPGLRLVNE
nr:helix-turn-helix domain-containing protein [Nocardia transvalensis]